MACPADTRLRAERACHPVPTRVAVRPPHGISAEEHDHTADPDGSREVRRARVQEFTSQSQRTETVRCFALVLAAAQAARQGGLVRLGVDAADLTRPGLRQALLDAVDVALENRAFGATYGSLRSVTA